MHASSSTEYAVHIFGAPLRGPERNFLGARDFAYEGPWRRFGRRFSWNCLQSFLLSSHQSLPLSLPGQADSQANAPKKTLHHPFSPDVCHPKLCVSSAILLPSNICPQAVCPGRQRGQPLFLRKKKNTFQSLFFCPPQQPSSRSALCCLANLAHPEAREHMV